MRLGAENFILHGDDSKSKGIKLAPVNPPPGADSPTSIPSKESAEEDSQPNSSDAIDESQGPIAEITKCCQEWRAGRVSPIWYYTLNGSGGCPQLECLTIALLTATRRHGLCAQDRVITSPDSRILRLCGLQNTTRGETGSRRSRTTSGCH